MRSEVWLRWIMAEVEVGMRILVIADIESKALWDYFDKSMLENVDLIVSCGDLNPKYLSFLATFTKAPVIYVRGNHDAKYEMTPPDGCICIEDDIFEFHGVRLLGLGGSMRYKEGSNMFTEKEMKKRVNKMRFKLRKKDGFDILVTHAPAYQLNDGDDIPHKGFQVFRDLMDFYKPLCLYMVMCMPITEDVIKESVSIMKHV